MRPSPQYTDTEKLPWGIRAVILVWLVWLVLAHASRIFLDLYTALSPLRYLGAESVQGLRSTIFAPGALVAVALLIPVAVSSLIAFRMVAARYRGAPLQALGFTRLHPVWVLAVVVLFSVLLTFLLRATLGWSNYPLPLLEPPAALFTSVDVALYVVGVPLTALLAGLLVFGFCYPILAEKLGVWIGGLLCAVFFALPQLAVQGVYWQSAVSLLIMGIYFTAVRAQTESSYSATLGYTGFSIYIALTAALAELAVAP